MLGRSCLPPGSVAVRPTVCVLPPQFRYRIGHQGPHDDTVAKVDYDNLACVPPRTDRRRYGHLTVAGDRHHVFSPTHAGIV